MYISALKNEGTVTYKIKDKWVELNRISTRKAVLADSLFLRFMDESITRIGGKFSKDFIILKFDYDAEYKINGGEPQKIKTDNLRTYYYTNGVTFTSEVKDTKKRKQAKEDERCHPIHYKMLMRSPGKAKDNSIYKVQMPCITPHVCRHTFCSNMAKSGMNPKTLQYIMGHSDIGVTLNTYTHLQFEDALEEMKKVVG